MTYIHKWWILFSKMIKNVFQTDIFVFKFYCMFFIGAWRRFAWSLKSTGHSTHTWCLSPHRTMWWSWSISSMYEHDEKQWLNDRGVIYWNIAIPHYIYVLHYRKPNISQYSDMTIFWLVLNRILTYLQVCLRFKIVFCVFINLPCFKF